MLAGKLNCAPCFDGHWVLAKERSEGNGFYSGEAVIS
jgi:hypothetical protein